MNVRKILNAALRPAGYELARRRDMPVMFIVANGGKFESRMTPQFAPYIAVASRD